MRYRLTQTDVGRFFKEGYLEERTTFAGAVLRYRIEKTHDFALSASYKDNVITLFMPFVQVQELVNTNTVGFENQYGQLHLLVEKDFTCLDNVAEDQSDNYPNPLAVKSDE